MSATTFYTPAVHTPTVLPVHALPPQEAQYAKAPTGARVLASLIDIAIALAALIPGGLLLLALKNEQEALPTVPLVVLAVGFAYTLWYSYTKDGARGGASIGKRHTGLMVVHLQTGRPCTKARSFVRAALWVATGNVPVIGVLIEPLLALCTADGRRIGDRIAGTQVIRASNYRAADSHPLRLAA